MLRNTNHNIARLLTERATLRNTYHNIARLLIERAMLRNASFVESGFRVQLFLTHCASAMHLICSCSLVALHTSPEIRTFSSHIHQTVLHPGFGKMFQTKLTWNEASQIFKCACLNECFETIQQLSTQFNLEEKMKEQQDLIMSYHLTTVKFFIKQQQEKLSGLSKQECKQIKQIEQSLLQLRRIKFAANAKAKHEMKSTIQQLHQICKLKPQFRSILQQIQVFDAFTVSEKKQSTVVKALSQIKQEMRQLKKEIHQCNVHLLELKKNDTLVKYQEKTKEIAQSPVETNKHLDKIKSSNHNISNVKPAYKQTGRQKTKPTQYYDSSNNNQTILPGRVRGWLENPAIDGQCLRLQHMRDFYQKNKRLSRKQIGVVEEILKPYETIRIWLECPAYLSTLPNLRKKWLNFKFLSQNEINLIRQAQHCSPEEFTHEKAKNFWKNLSFKQRQRFALT